MNQVFAKLDANYIPIFISRCWFWWIGEIKVIVFHDMLGKVKGNHRKTIAALTDSEIHIIEQKSAKNIKTAKVFERSSQGWERAIAYLVSIRGSALKSRKFGLRIDVDTCHKREFRIPRHAASDLPKIAKFELERKTPFQLEDIYTDYFTTPDEDNEDIVIVHQYLIKRSRLDDIVQFIKTAGLELSFMDIFEVKFQNSLPVNLFNMQAPKSAIAKASRLNKILFLGIILLLVSAIHLLFSREDQALEKLNAEIAQSRKIALSVRHQIDNINQATQKIAKLRNLKLNTVPLTQVWSDITRLLPDTAWLSEIKIRAKRVQITGFASSAAKLIGILEKSHLFSSVSFESSVVFDSRSNKERFSIAFQLEPGDNAKKSDAEKRRTIK